MELAVPSADFQIRTRLIPTKYGEVFSLESGQYGQPLILIIHGSGPDNHSGFYEFMLFEYNARVSYLEKFYLLAIDCPGYGQSVGSKQAIKTFPRELLRQILQAINYKSYFALMGHSQGGAAIFNAVYQDPTLTEIMIMDRPVCGNIQRFNGFLTPTLLVYDIEDDGHPIWQGKQLYKQLKNSELYTFRSSRTPFWVGDHMWDYILQFIGRWCRGNNQQKLKHSTFYRNRAPLETGNRRDDRPGTTSSPIHSASLAPKKPQATSVSPAKRPKKGISLEKPTIKEVQQDEDQMIIQMQEMQMERQSSINRENRFMPAKKYEEVRTEILPTEPAPKVTEVKEKPTPTIKKKSSEAKLPREKSKGKPPAKRIQVKEVKEQQPRDQEKEEYKCSLCLDTYFKPTQINCKHIFCWKCITETMLVNPRCPLCRRDFSQRTELPDLHQKMITELIPAANLKKREEEWNKFSKMIKSIIFVELGNTSTLIQTKQSTFSKTKKKYNWELFVVEPRNFKFESVDFNINMGEPNAKPVKIRQAPFCYQNRSTFSFSCQITIHPRAKEYPPLVVVYRIEIQEGRHVKKVALKKREDTI